MRNPNAVDSTISAVPISLYRELCSELQAKSGEIDALQLKNQRIVEENQQLRQELQRLVQMVMHTHQQISQIPTADSVPPTREQFHPKAPSMSPAQPARVVQSNLQSSQAVSPIAQAGATTVQPNRRVPSATAQLSKLPIQSSDREEWIAGTHQPLAQRLFQQSATMAQDLRGWRLALVIGLIILSAFGAGFLIVRPLINQQSSSR